MNVFFFLSFLAEYTSKRLQRSCFWKELWGVCAIFSRTHSLYSSLGSTPQRTSQHRLTVVVTKTASFARERAIIAKGGAFWEALFLFQIPHGPPSLG